MEREASRILLFLEWFEITGLLMPIIGSRPNGGLKVRVKSLSIGLVF